MTAYQIAMERCRTETTYSSDETERKGRQIMRRDIVKILLIALVFILIAGCGGSTRHSEKPILVTTTTIIRNVVASIAGTDFDVISLLPVGADPHVFEPSPADIKTLNEADLIFINGLGLEKTWIPS